MATVLEDLQCLYRGLYRVVNECRTSPNEMERHFYLELICFRGHSNSPEILDAYALARRGAQGNWSTGWCTNVAPKIYYANLN